MAKLTARRVRALLTYDESTGVLRWQRRSGSRGAGAIAGCLAADGVRARYLIGIDGKSYLLHRVIWLYVYGAFPAGQIDHINHDSSDNRLVNLRAASNQQNSWNQPLRKANTTGFKGVCFDKSRGKYVANIRDGKRKINLGRFADPEMAAQAYKQAAIKLHGEFACHE